MVGRAWAWAGSLAITVAIITPLTVTAATANPDPRTTRTSAFTSQAPLGRWVTILGRGFGHGVGMAQDGAYWMGRQGRSSGEILRHFYPGTALGSRTGNIRVPLGGAGTVTLTLEEGGTVGGRRVAPGGSVTVRPGDGELIATVIAPPELTGAQSGSPAPAFAMKPISLRLQTPTAPGDTPASTPAFAPALPPPATPSSVEPSAGALFLPGMFPDPPPPSSTEPAPVASSSDMAAPRVTNEAKETAPIPPADSPSGATPDTVRGNPLVVASSDGGTVAYAGKRYRGSFELRAQGSIRIVNELDVEQYLRGMGEITDARWPAAALEAQAIAARTYAFRTMASAGEVCPTQRCQVYVGVRAEYSAMDDAVAATRGKVVTYDKGKLAVTFYSASGGGTIATPLEAFGGSGDFPYLQSGTYPTGDLKSWVVTMTIDEVGRRVGYPGRAARAEVTRVGPSGRATEVTVSGDTTELTIEGPRFDAALGLRSTLFTLRQSDTPTIGGVGDVDVLSPSEPTQIGDDGAASDVFAQTGVLESPRSYEEPTLSAPDAVTSDSVATPESEAAEQPAGVIASPMSQYPPEEAFSARPLPDVTDQSRQSDGFFIGALTALGAAALAVARRWLRTRRGRLKPPR